MALAADCHVERRANRDIGPELIVIGVTARVARPI